MEVAHTTGFALGDTVVIDKGTAVEETRVISAFGSIVVSTPLIYEHSAGFTVEKAASENSSTSQSSGSSDSVGSLVGYIVGGVILAICIVYAIVDRQKSKRMGEDEEMGEVLDLVDDEFVMDSSSFEFEAPDPSDLATDGAYEINSEGEADADEALDSENALEALAGNRRSLPASFLSEGGGATSDIPDRLLATFHASMKGSRRSGASLFIPDTASIGGLSESGTSTSSGDGEVEVIYGGSNSNIGYSVQ